MDDVNTLTNLEHKLAQHKRLARGLKLIKFLQPDFTLSRCFNYKARKC